MSDLHSFRSDVEAFLEANEISPTRFGREVVNDASFVSQLRNGREPRSAIRDRVRSYMQAQPATVRGGNAGVAA